MSDFKPSRLWPVLSTAIVLLALAGYLQISIKSEHVDSVLVTIDAATDAVVDGVSGGDAGDVFELPGGDPLGEEHAQARRAARRGDYEVAFDLFRQALEGSPDSGQVHAELGFWLLRQRRISESATALKKATQLSPDDPWIVLTQGRVQALGGDPVAAEASYRRALSLKPSYGIARVALGSSLRRSGRVEEAIEILLPAAASGGNEERARALAALGRAYLSAGRRALAVDVLAEAINLAPANVDVRLSVAWAWMKELDGAEVPRAVELLRETKAIAPEVAEVHAALGRAHDLSGASELAGQEYTRALQIDPTYLYARRSFLRLSLARDDYSEAESQATYLLDAAGDVPEHQLLAGLVAARQKRTRDARAYYERALTQAGGTYPEALFNLGLLEKKAGNPDAAIAAYRSALQQRPDYATAANNLGLVLEQAGHVDEAEATYRELLESNPSYAGGWLNLGSLLASAGRYGGAIDSVERALEAKPGYPKAMLNLGVTYSKAGRLDEAVHAYRALVQLHPRYVSGWYNLGAALRKRGDPDNARRAWQKALALDESHRKSREGLARLEVRAGHYQVGVHLYQDLVDRHPADRKLRRAFARVLRDSGDPAGCLREVQAILANEPGDRGARLLGRTCEEPAGAEGRAS